MCARSAAVVVAVLAGGRGARLGGSKPTTLLAGRPLISYPLAAARDAGLAAIVIAKPDTVLPRVQERVVFDSERLHHPLAGILPALHQSDAVIALPCDMPFVTGTLLRWLAGQEPLSLFNGTSGSAQPFPVLYRSHHIRSLRRSMQAERSMRVSIEQLRPRLLDDRELDAFGAKHRLFFTVNTPDDLESAEQALRCGQTAASRQA